MLASDTLNLGGRASPRAVPPSRVSTPRATHASQLERLNRLLHRVWRHNPFYRCKWRSAGLTARDVDSLDALAHYPLTSRAELLADQTRYSPLGTNITCSPAQIKHIHRSSGTTDAPLFWGDTPESWDWVTRASQALFELAGVTATDRVLILLPFGVSSGPWIIRAGARRLGCCTFAAGVHDSSLGSILQRFSPTVVVGNAITLHSLDLNCFPIDTLILTGSRPPEEARSPCNLKCFSRYGLTEAGSVAGECHAHTGMHLLEENFIAEVIDPTTSEPVPDGAPGELVLTTLGRIAQPIIRYRTGDIVRLLRQHACPCGRKGALLVGSVKRGGNGHCVAVREGQP